MRRAVLLLCLVASPALAAGPSAAGKPDTPLVKGGPPGTNVEMPYLMAPMKDADGKLTGYAYISSRLTASSPAAALAVRNQLAFIQDAFVRDVNGAGVTGADPATVDIAAVEARLADDARRVVGGANVKFMTVCTLQIANLHLKKAPALADPSADGDDAPPSRCEPESGGK